MSTLAPARGAPRGDAAPGDARLGELRARLIGPPAGSGAWAWLGPVVVAALAGVLRFWRLDQPHQLVFDETYYVKQGYTLLREGYEVRWPTQEPGSTVTPSPDATFTAGTPDIYLTGNADFVVHPPVGKWVNAVGMQIFGAESSWGWRFGVALLGTLSVLMLARIARRLFASTTLGVVAGLLLAVDGHHLVHSRTALLDMSLMFFALAAFGCLLVDRDRSRELLARLVAGGASLDRLGPGLGLRPWRLAAGVCLGLACGTKWSGVYFVAVFGLMTVLWDAGARRAVGVRRWFVAAAVRDGLPAFTAVVGAGVLAYLVSWTGWFRSTQGWDRTWAQDNPPGGAGRLVAWVPDGVLDPLRGLWHYHADAYRFHIDLGADHPYEANPWSWLVQGRPTSFFYEGTVRGDPGCVFERCSEAILPVGNLVVWWGGTLGVVVALAAWALRRDWRAGAVLAGLAAGYLPWFAFPDRTIFGFYAIAFTPWVVLSLTYLLGLVIGPPDAGRGRARWGVAAVGATVVAAVAFTAYFWPIYTAQLIPYAEWQGRMLFRSWV